MAPDDNSMPVADDVVLERLDLERIHGLALLHAALGHGKGLWLNSICPVSALRSYMEIDDPAKIEAVFGEQS